MPRHKRRQIASVHADLDRCSRVCKGRGICSNSCKSLAERSGKFQGVLRTLLAEPYPKTLRNASAQSFKGALAAIEMKGY
eukprot:4952010-Pyramimonas_sp.AAC.1